MHLQDRERERERDSDAVGQRREWRNRRRRVTDRENGERKEVTLPERNIIRRARRTVIPTCLVFGGEAVEAASVDYPAGKHGALLSIGPTICRPHIDAILSRSCIMNGRLMTLRSLRKPLREDGGGVRDSVCTSGIKHAPPARTSYHSRPARERRLILLVVYRSVKEWKLYRPFVKTTILFLYLEITSCIRIGIRRFFKLGSMIVIQCHLIICYCTFVVGSLYYNMSLQRKAFTCDSSIFHFTCLGLCIAWR